MRVAVFLVQPSVQCGGLTGQVGRAHPGCLPLQMQSAHFGHLLQALACKSCLERNCKLCQHHRSPSSGFVFACVCPKAQKDLKLMSVPHISGAVLICKRLQTCLSVTVSLGGCFESLSSVSSATC